MSASVLPFVIGFAVAVIGMFLIMGFEIIQLKEERFGLLITVDELKDQLTEERTAAHQH